MESFLKASRENANSSPAKPLTLSDFEDAFAGLWESVGDDDFMKGWIRVEGAMEWEGWGGLCRPTAHDNVYQCTWAKHSDNIRDVKTTFLKIEDSGEMNLFIPIGQRMEAPDAPPTEP